MARLAIHITTEHPDVGMIAAERTEAIVQDLDADGAHAFDVELVDYDGAEEGLTIHQWTRTPADIKAASD